MTITLITVAVVAVCFIVYRMTISYLFTEEVRADEVHMVATQDDWQVRLCRYRPAKGSHEPVFLCPGALGNQFNFTSPAGESLVDVLVEKGYDCWVIDLRGCRSSRAPTGHRRYDVNTDDYLLYDIPAALDFIRDRSGFAQVHWVGHSLGGMLLYAHELVHGLDAVASGTTIGSPPGFNGAQTTTPGMRLALLDLMPGIVESAIRAASPLLPLFRMRSAMSPVNWSNMHPRVGSATFFNLMEILPPGVASDLSVWAANGSWRMKGGSFDVQEGLKRLRTPLLAIYGADDPLVSLSQADDFFDHLPTSDKRKLVLSKENGHSADYNHVDLAFARNGRAEVYEPVAQWLAAHPISEKGAREKDSPEAPARGAVKVKTRATARKAAAKRVSASAKKKAPAKKKAAKKQKAPARKKAPAKKKAATKKKTPAKKKAPVKKKVAKKKAAR